jgi:hypothetical protein
MGSSRVSAHLVPPPARNSKQYRHFSDRSKSGHTSILVGIRDAIKMSFLEHALETEGLRRYFENWSTDSRLCAAWERALKWGKAHPDFTWGLLRQVPKPEK